MAVSESEPIKPALTPQEWAAYLSPRADPVAVGGQRDELRVYRGFRGITIEASERNEYERGQEGQASAPVERPHAIAALALYGQSFGFTWGHVATIRANCVGFRFLAEKIAMSAMMEAEVHKLLAIADRIAALLPPMEQGTR